MTLQFGPSAAHVRSTPVLAMAASKHPRHSMSKGDPCTIHCRPSSKSWNCRHLHVCRVSLVEWSDPQGFRLQNGIEKTPRLCGQEKSVIPTVVVHSRSAVTPQSDVWGNIIQGDIMRPIDRIHRQVAAKRQGKLSARRRSLREVKSG